MSKKTLRIKTSDYKYVGHSAFADRFVEIIQAIIANIAIFLNIPISQVALEDAAEAIIEKTNRAKEGSSADKESRDTQAEICLGYLDILANYVLQLAATKPTLQQQIELVTLSKFTLCKIDPQPAPPLSQVSGVTGKWTGVGNEALIEWDRLGTGNVALYNIYKTSADPSNPSTVWTLAGSTAHRKMLISDLAPVLSAVWVKIVAVGKEGETSVPSDPALVAVEF